VPDDGKTAPGHRLAADDDDDDPIPTIQVPSGDPMPVGEPPPMPLERYHLGDEIARGGMGRVVEATDTVLGRTVALKEALAFDPEALRRFARETRITARLEHPSIVPVHDAGTLPSGAPYYVMRKISGRPLEKLVVKSSALEERLGLLPHIVAAANAIAHAHERGIVHRDVKPSNILVGELGETIVIDWGCAKVIGEPDEPSADVPVDVPIDPLADSLKTRAGIVFGTPGFMAPEQLKGAEVNEQTDVYALGATLYHLLARRPPHHAKTADEVMRAAITSPPTPIRELVPGVPPELATVVDKALAQDPSDRYHSARELAEELQSFLTGQLVKSHHYSRRERLLRFARKNRVPVMIAGAAAVALIVGGTIAVTRVIGERDRADVAARIAREEQRKAEAERANAEDRLDKLALAQARSLVATNPTAAVALLKPLAARHWREVRSIATAARAAGVAWALPASKRTVTLELSRDGTRALAAGDDGAVRIYDLAHHRTRTVATIAGVPAVRWADDERAIVVWHGTSLAVLDATTGAERLALTTRRPVHDLETVGTSAYWTDEDRALWLLDLTGKAPVALPTEEPVEQLAPSPDGRWIALYGDRHLLVYDRSQPTAPATALMLGAVRDFDWSDDGKSFAGLIEQTPGERLAIRGEVDTAPAIVQKRLVGNRTFVAYGNHVVYTIGPTGVATVPEADNYPLAGDPVGLAEARGGTMVAGVQGGILAIAPTGNHELKVPAGRIDLFAASARAPYVIATIEDHLLVWDLAEVEPRVVASQLPALARFAGTDRVVLAFADDAGQIVELDTGARHPLPAWPLRDVVASPSGRAILAVELGRKAHLIVGNDPPRDLAGDVDVAGFVDEDQLVIGNTPKGSLELVDVKSAARTPLVTRPAKLLELAWSSRGVAALFSDGTLWRRDLASGRTETVALPATPRLVQLAMTPDGCVLFADDRALRVWRPDTNDVAVEATLPHAILAFGPVAGAHALAFTETDGVYVVDLATPERFSESDPLDEHRAALAIDTGAVVVASRAGIDIVDPVVRHRWTLAAAGAQQAFSEPQISRDGRRVLAQTGRVLLAWTFEVPGTPEDTAAWLARLTNAVSEPAGLGWR
jgi:eukaryotic-like serine/threonine-protein kinase